MTQDYSGKIIYKSMAGSIEMTLEKPSDLVKAFKSITFMEQSRIDRIKDLEKELKEAKKKIEEDQ